MNLKRIPTQILLEILRFLYDNPQGIIKTRIMYKINMSYDDTKNKLNILLSKNLIKFVPSKNNEFNNGKYYITQEGIRILMKVEKAMEDLNLLR